MFLSVSKCLLLFLLWIPSECHLQEHRQFQYNTQTDGRGTYNFAYDTSHQPLDAHSLRMEYRDANGIVRGRYGYTDPRGKLRIVEYEAGPEGFKARGDVGPDLFPHMEAPGLSPQKPDPAPTPLRMAGSDPVRDPINERDVTDNDYYYDLFPHMEARGLSPQKPDPAPTPLRMAGWDPVRDPINERDVTDNDYYSPYSVTPKKPRRAYIRYYDQNQLYSRPRSYPVISQKAIPDVEIFQQDLTTEEKKSEPLRSNQPLTIYNIDVDPDEIRVAGPPAESRSTGESSRPVYRGREIIATSPEITYYERSSRRRIPYVSHSDYYHRGRTSDHHSHSERVIQKPRQVRYRPSSHYHDQQYHFN